MAVICSSFLGFQFSYCLAVHPLDLTYKLLACTALKTFDQTVE
ncbi:hypothetical protein MTR67_021462 [Solanum verrucosum]|uniref:Uncharacterized protein n=1 Tax=Solanum verrucosum TaxID=315347 RepID=A0AAF0QQ41_SOLVR|nr:hypothetical protein MTR67_021462 [Solanum verrucosum]